MDRKRPKQHFPQPVRDAEALRLHELRDRILIHEQAAMPGVTLEVSACRLWVRFRGDPIGNWRCADAYFVFEDDAGILSVTLAVDSVVDVSLAAIAAYLVDFAT